MNLTKKTLCEIIDTLYLTDTYAAHNHGSDYINIMYLMKLHTVANKVFLFQFIRHSNCYYSPYYLMR